MRWINSLERRFGFLAVPGLIRVIVVLNAIVYLMLKAQPDFIDVLTLEPRKIMAGELWRLVSYVFIPRVNVASSLSLVWVFLYLYFLWLMGEGLEQAWGSFKLNLFYVVGMVGTAVATLVFGAGNVTGLWLNTSLFFAFATLFPNFVIMVYFVFPVAAKWVALTSFAFVLLNFISGDFSTRAVVIVSFANYLVFFGQEWVRQWRAQRRVVKRRQRFQIARKTGVAETLHQCTVCGSTEVSAPETEFRVAADGEEYCTQHLPVRGTAALSPPVSGQAGGQRP